MTTIRQACLLLPLALAACGGPSLTHQDRRSAGIETFYSYGAAGRDLKLDVRGNPFASPPEATARAVEAAVQGATWLAPTRPRLAPGPSAESNYRLVYAFDAGGAATGDQLCSGRAPVRGSLSGQPSGKVQAIAAFCQQGQSLVSVEGTQVASGPDDPRFADLVRSMSLYLFSRDNRDDDDRRCGAPFC